MSVQALDRTENYWTIFVSCDCCGTRTESRTITNVVSSESCWSESQWSARQGTIAANSKTIRLLCRDAGFKSAGKKKRVCSICWSNKRFAEQLDLSAMIQEDRMEWRDDVERSTEKKARGEL